MVAEMNRKCQECREMVARISELEKREKTHLARKPHLADSYKARISGLNLSLQTHIREKHGKNKEEQGSGNASLRNAPRKKNGRN